MPITIRQSQVQPGSTIRQIAPTLIIGLGGSGKEVLLRIRRRFFERFGEVGFPILSYLWVDTDLRNLDLEGEKYDYMMEKVAFAAEEKLDAQVTGTNFVSYFRDRENHPHIFSWLDPSLEAYGQVVDGAGQKRPFGRLAFFHHHHRIRERLLAMKNSVLDLRATERLAEVCRRHDLDMPQVDRARLDVIFVFSVAGGTGSGMFLDAAFFCRQVLAGSFPGLTAYLLLPSVFNPDVNSQSGQPIYANGYAALKELEHFSLAKDLLRRDDEETRPESAMVSDHHFQVEWTRGEPMVLPGPPFNTCYLLDSQSRASQAALAQGDKKDLCDMVAEAVFLDFSEGSFAAAKRSTRSNLEQFLLGKVDMDYQERDSRRILYTDIFSCRFSSFGLTKLFVPADRIRRDCSYRLSVDLLDRLIASSPLPADASTQVRKHYFADMGLEPLALLRWIGRAADNSETLVEQELAKTIADEAARWRDTVPDASSPAVRELRERLRREMTQPSDPRARQGEYLERIRAANPRQLALRLFGRFDAANDDLWAIANDEPAHTDATGNAPAGSIGKVVRQWLDDPRFRLPLARGYLKTTAAVFREELLPRWAQDAQDRAATAAQLDESINRRVAMLESEEESSGKLRASKRALLRRIQRDLTGWAGASLAAVVYQTAQRFVTESLLPYLASFDRFLGGLKEDLQKVREELVERSAAYQARRPHQIFEEILDKNILETSYRLKAAGGPVQVTPELLDRFGTEVLAAMELRGAADLGQAVARGGREALANTIEAQAFSRFSDLQVRFDVLEELRRIRPASRDSDLRAWARRGSYWLPPGEVVQRTHDLDSTLMDLVFIGAPRSDLREDARLLKIIADTVSEKAPPRSGGVQMLEATGTGSVYVYSEVAGVSLPAVRGIDRYYKDAYLSARRRESVHIDFHEEKFPQEVVLREFAEVRDYLEAFRVLLMGTITGVLRSRLGSTGRLSWSFMDLDRRPPQPIELGPEFFAVNTLMRQGDLAARIRRTLRDAVAALAPERRTQLYAVLMRNLDPAGSFPIRFRRRGGVVEEVNSHGRHLLEEEAQLVEDLAAKDGANRQQLNRQVSALAGTEATFSRTVPWEDPPLWVLIAAVLEGDAARGWQGPAAGAGEPRSR